MQKWKEKKGYLFIWMIIDHSSTLLIGCYKQPVKCAALSILVICKDISIFLTYRLFVIIHLHSSCLLVQYAAFARPGRLVL